MQYTFIDMNTGLMNELIQAIKEGSGNRRKFTAEVGIVPLACAPICLGGQSGEWLKPRQSRLGWVTCGNPCVKKKKEYPVATLCS